MATSSQQYDTSSMAIKEKNSDLATVVDGGYPISPSTRTHKKEPSMVDLALEKAAEARERDRKIQEQAAAAAED